MTGKGDALTGLEPRHKYLRQVGERGAAGSEPAASASRSATRSRSVTAPIRPTMMPCGTTR